MPQASPAALEARAISATIEHPSPAREQKRIEIVIKSQASKILPGLLLVCLFVGGAACGDSSGGTNGEPTSGDGSTDGHASVRDATVGDATVSDAAIGDAAVGDAADDDSTVRDATIGDTMVRDAAGGDAIIDAAAVRDAAISDAAVGDATIGDGTVGDAAIGDATIGDGTVGDAAIGDTAIGDAIGDGTVGDAAVGDAAVDGTDPDGTSRPARASVSLHVQEYDRMDPGHSMDVCPPARHWVDVPYQRGWPPNNQSQQTSDTYAPLRAVNGENGDAVSCTVRSKGGVFEVMADATGYAEDYSHQINPSVVHIRIASIGNGDSSATGTITIQDATSIVPYSSAQCVFSTQGGSLGVDAGHIWASARCENLADPAYPNAVCQLDIGFFVFEDCVQ